MPYQRRGRQVYIERAGRRVLLRAHPSVWAAQRHMAALLGVRSPRERKAGAS